MTDNEIIKALECCISSGECKGCPSYIEKDDDCLGIKWLSILDLINRQQETIKTLRNCVEQYHIIRKDGKSPLSLLTEEIKAEAIKEFAESITNKATAVQVGNISWVWQISQDDIDNLVKEMVGEE